MTSMPRDENACKLAAQMKRRRYTYAQIADELVRRFPTHIPHLTRQAARGYVDEGIRAENAAIAEEIASDPYSSPVRDYILDRIRGRLAQAQTLDEVEQEAWTTLAAHPDMTIKDFSDTFKWVSAERRLLLGLSPVDDAPGGSAPPAPDPDLQRRFDAADPGV